MDALKQLVLYQYEPLENASDNIRVIELKPASERHAPLQAQIHHIPLKAAVIGAQRYEVVSYCWGLHQKTHSIICNDIHQIPLTHSVAIMLQFLRKSNQSRYLWIDALCINQENNVEKDIQVQLMDKVYRYATKTHIWLGEPTKGLSVQRLFAGLKSVVLLALEPRHMEKQAKEIMADVCGEEYSNCITWVLERPWFRRRWILQEFFFSQHSIFRCGADKIPSDTFIRANKILVNQSVFLSFASQKSLRILDNIPTRTDGCFLDLLWKFDMSKCSFPEDHIFALHNFVRDSKDIIEVNYGKTWTETFTKLAAEFWSRKPGQVIEHLAAFGPLTDRTWVPDWRNEHGNREKIGIALGSISD